MKNFIFKSTDADLQKLFIILELIQKEQRHARYDLQVIIKETKTLIKGMAILVSSPDNSPEPEDLQLPEET